MQERTIYIADDPNRSLLLRELRGKVFHLTTENAFSAIRREGKVGHNQHGRYPLNHGSIRSFGRLHGLVCLYDLRDCTSQRLRWIRRLCDFLHPDWQIGADAATSVFLVLHPAALPELIPNVWAYQCNRMTGRHLKYLPGAECWYPGDLPLSSVAEALHLRMDRLD